MNLNYFKIKQGDTVGIVAPSSGAAREFPHVFKEGVKNLQEIFHLKTKEFPTCSMTSEELYNNPQKRAGDINNAFADQEVKAIIAAIGGDDSVRILPYLDWDTIRSNPKIFMAYSDGTILLTQLCLRGLPAFHGPSVMAGLAQSAYLPDEFIRHIETMFFEHFDEYEYKSYLQYTDGYSDWHNPQKSGEINRMKNDDGWHWLNCSETTTGQLFGGCIEALEFLKSTQYWPPEDFWNGKVLFLETSEEKPSINQVKYMLRNYGTQGVFHKIAALIFGRARDYTNSEKKLLEKIIAEVVTKEFGMKYLPIITNIDFGHTDPQLILPLGGCIEINPKAKSITLKSGSRGSSPN